MPAPTRLALAACAAAVMSVFAPAHDASAAAITNGNLVVYRVGTGTGALAATGTAVFLDEYTTAGTLVQSIAVPTTGTTALTATGNSTSEGILSLNGNGTSVSFTGYRVNAGTAIATTTPRLIGSVNLAGTVDTSIVVTDVGSNAIRSAWTADGSSYYLATAGAVRYVASPGPAATSVVIDARNSRQVLGFGGTIYGSNGSTALTPKVQSYGTSPVAVTVPTPVVTLALTDAVNGFIVLDLSDTVAGPDTVYAASTVGARLVKYTFDGTSWAAAGFISSTVQNLTAIKTDLGVDLFLTTGGSLQKLSDNSAFGGLLTGTPTTIATAGTNTAFRGLAVIPEPSSLALLGLLAPLAFRRR